MPATDTASREQQISRWLMVAGIAVGAFLLYALASTFAAERDTTPFDASLPNPMGGPARPAPGEASGELSLGGLQIEGAEVAMGDVALGVTYVPGWELVNTSDEDTEVRVGQPQVLEGCCPGPIYADGELTEAGQALVVPAGDTMLLQFPLQMHPGMDGPHHLAVPLAVGDEAGALHVIGNFTADAAA